MASGLKSEEFEIPSRWCLFPKRVPRFGIAVENSNAALR
ncbi:hypothetical protein ABH908_000232 [Pseudomonas frederiksbergensis]